LKSRKQIFSDFFAILGYDVYFTCRLRRNYCR